MNRSPNKCPNCGKPDGLVAVGADFEHVQAGVRIKGTGSFCKKCSWSRRDPVSTHYQGACGSCGTPLGTHSLDEGKVQPKHYCPACSLKRVTAALHNPEALTSFPLKCNGCGTVIGHLSFPEGSVLELSPAAQAGYFCNAEPCAKKRRAVEQVAVNMRKVEAAVKGAASLK